MTASTLAQPLYGLTDEATERRFANILLACLIALLFLTTLIAISPRIQQTLAPSQPPAKRIAKLVINKKTQPPPPKPQPKPVQKKPQIKPVKKKPGKTSGTQTGKKQPKTHKKPAPSPAPAAGKKQHGTGAPRDVSKQGVLAMADSFKGLLHNQAAESASDQSKLTKGVTASRHTTRKLITSDFGKGTTGIQSHVGGKPGKLGGVTQLAGHSTIKLGGLPGGGQFGATGPGGHGTGGFGSGGSGSGVGGYGSGGYGAGGNGNGGQPMRSSKNIQIVFDRNKASLFALYQRALRRHPKIQGALVLKLVIQPSGHVSSVSIISSGLHDNRLEQQLINRIKHFNFGAKDVPVWEGPYPIRFFPS